MSIEVLRLSRKVDECSTALRKGGGFLGSAIGGFKTMREELVRIGFGPFEVGLLGSSH